MRAMVFDHYGEPDVMSLREVPVHFALLGCLSRTPASALVSIIERVWNTLQRSDLAAAIPMTLPAICSNFLFLLATLASAFAVVCTPLNHRSGDFGDFLNQ